MGNKLKWFRNPIRDVRIRRIAFGDRMQVEPIGNYSITFLPSFYMWFHEMPGEKSDKQVVRMCGLVFRFLFWSIDVFDYSYTRPFVEPWMEDLGGNYIETVADYYRKQKH